MGEVDLGSMERSSRIQPANEESLKLRPWRREEEEDEQGMREPELEPGNERERPGRRGQPEKGDESSSTAGMWPGVEPRCKFWVRPHQEKIHNPLSSSNFHHIPLSIIGIL